MRFYAFLIAIAIALGAGVSSAAARPNDGSLWTGKSQGSIAGGTGASRSYAGYGSRGTRTVRYSGYSGSSRGLGPRPRKWCGWWMRTQKGGGRHLNVAWNWSKWGRPTGPQIGAVVVWRHHVGIITGRAANGQWIVTSGNDGGRVRSRARSVRGAVFRI